jgi:hypothetical protein
VVNKHIEMSLDKIRVIFQKASEKIEALKVGQKIPATVLSDDIAKDCDMTGPQLYPTLLFLIKGYPGVEVKRGAKGGIYKISENIEIENDLGIDVDEGMGERIPEEEDKFLPIINT